MPHNTIEPSNILVVSSRLGKDAKSAHTRMMQCHHIRHYTQVVLVVVFIVTVTMHCSVCSGCAGCNGCASRTGNRVILIV